MMSGKKKDEKEMVKEQSGCCCGGNCNEESVEAAKETLSSGANVKVLGGGCDKCNALEKNVKEALRDVYKRQNKYYIAYCNYRKTML